MEADPVFAKPKSTVSVDEQKRRAALQMNKMNELNLVPRITSDSSYKDKVSFRFLGFMLRDFGR